MASRIAKSWVIGIQNKTGMETENVCPLTESIATIMDGYCTNANFKASVNIWMWSSG